MSAVPNLQPAPEDASGAIERLRGENLALQSVLHGLCVSLARMSEVNREMVVAALDHAEGVRRMPSARSPEASEGFAAVVGQLREAVLVYRDDVFSRR